MVNTSEIVFYINGKEHKVSQKFSATTSLNDYLRNEAGLKGTKVMCREAGCGCCSVAVTYKTPDRDTLETHSVQSCLTPLYAVDGWQISTIEGIGSQRDGFHPIQERIAKFNGTQCGYCTPGMVMNMYGLLHQQPNITAQEIEDNFDGNMCRCTGYRPILDAMKSFATDGNIPEAKPIDIEDLNKHLCPKTGESCTGDHAHKGGNTSLELELDGHKWIRPTSLEELGSSLRANKDKKIKLVYGNTASGIFKNEGPFDVHVDLHQVKYLYSYQVTAESVRFGAATSLTSFMSKLKENQNRAGFQYFSAMVKHLKVIANVMVRNAGCIAGNLMIKYSHPDFPSDIFTMLAALGATLEIYDSTTSKFSTYTMLDFLRNVKMTGKVITAVILPKVSDNTVFKSFKVTPRWQNAHAYVNAAFKIETSNGKIEGKPSIVYGGINADTVHAEKTEEFLKDKEVTEAVVKEALSILKGELHPEYEKILASPKYRQELAVSLLYKVLLALSNTTNPKLRSGQDYIQRPISSGLQTYQEMKSEFPLKEPMPKRTAPLQASGEAQFVNDIPRFQQELYGAYVQTDQGSATLDSLDFSEALKMPGVVRILTAKDIPEGGTNNHMNAVSVLKFGPQELFATKTILFAGQALALVLAESQAQATAAAKAVKINYAEIFEPILSIEDSIAKDREIKEYPNKQVLIGKPDESWASVDKVIEGEIRMGSQYHFFMETHISLAVPSEDGIDLYAATQIATQNQVVAAEVIGKPLNFINIIVPRIGGGFGGKAWDTCHATASATLGAYLTGRPVRVSLDLSTTMTLCGKRAPILAKYKAGTSNDGDLQTIEMEFYYDAGSTMNSLGDVGHTMHYMDMAYNIPNWKINLHPMFTNKQTMSPTRAPGSVPAALVIESIMEHVAQEVGRHPIIVKELNLYEKHHIDMHGHEMTNCTIRELWRRLKDTAEVEGRMRQVDHFNQENLWKKRGITMTTSKYGLRYFGFGFTAHVSINAHDGSVVVIQAGVEMGQGLYTKVAQGVAHALGVPIEKIKVRPNQNAVTANPWVTGGSVGSEQAMMAAIGASQQLKERMQPIREKFPDLDWAELCMKCIESKINLSSNFLFAAEENKKEFCNYFTYCASVVETEVDILTGESQIRRVDIMADFGESLNPTIDIGQVEGAYVMGLGCFLSEDIVFDDKTGRILNDGTWEYKPPTTKDIPIDWRIHLLPDTPNPVGIRSSKASGEPPISLSVGALHANKLAVNAAKQDLFGKAEYFPVVAPYTVERVQQSVGLSLDKLTL